MKTMGMEESKLQENHAPLTCGTTLFMIGQTNGTSAMHSCMERPAARMTRVRTRDNATGMRTQKEEKARAKFQFLSRQPMNLPST